MASCSNSLNHCQGRRLRKSVNEASLTVKLHQFKLLTPRALDINEFNYQTWNLTLQLIKFCVGANFSHPKFDFEGEAQRWDKLQNQQNRFLAKWDLLMMPTRRRFATKNVTFLSCIIYGGFLRSHLIKTFSMHDSRRSSRAKRILRSSTTMLDARGRCRMIVKLNDFVWWSLNRTWEGSEVRESLQLLRVASDRSRGLRLNVWRKYRIKFRCGQVWGWSFEDKNQIVSRLKDVRSNEWVAHSTNDYCK